MILIIQRRHPSSHVLAGRLACLPARRQAGGGQGRLPILLRQ